MAARAATTWPSDAGGRELARRITIGSLLLFVAGRLIVVLASDLPSVTPDEPGAWAIAKWLSGTDGTFFMTEMPRYPLMSGVLLTPLWWLPVGPELRYQLGLVVTGALTAGAAFVVRAAVRRLTDDPMPVALAFAAMLLVPAASYATAFTYGEASVMAWWALLFWGVVAVSQGSHTAIVVTSAVAGTATATHGRLALVPVVWGACLLALAVRSLRQRRDARDLLVLGGGLLVLVTTLGVTTALHRAAGAALWTDAEPAVKVGPGAWLTDPGLWLAAVRELLGQLWYAVIASAGLAVAGVALLVRMALRPERSGERFVGLTLLALVTSNLLISTTVMAGFLHEAGYRDSGELIPPRLDHLIYGRYNDAAVLVLTCLGILWCWRARDRRRVLVVGAVAVATVLIGGIVVVELLRSISVPGYFPTQNASALSVVLPGRVRPTIEVFTLGGLLLVAAMTAGVARGRRAFCAVLAVWLLLGITMGTRDAVGVQVHDLPVDVAGVLDDPTPRDRIVLATDAAALPWLDQHYHLTQFDLLSRGWPSEFATVDSATLAAEPGSATVLLLVDGVSPGRGWRAAAVVQDAHVWLRDPS